MTEASALSGALKQPFGAQVAYWRQKLGTRVPTERWDDLEGRAHDKAFAVAGAMKGDLLADLAAAVDRAIAEGGSLDAFRRDFMTVVQERGWTGFTGDTGPAARAWRTRTIYTTNAATSYAAGRLAQLREAGFTHWVYRHSHLSREPRPEHLSWDGRIVAADDAWWATHYPPNGWGCRCYVTGAFGLTGARRVGGREVGAPTAAASRTGVDRGWDHAPGGSVLETIQRLAERPVQWPYQIGRAFFASLPGDQRDALARAYRTLPSLRDDVQRWAERVLGERRGAPLDPDLEVEPYRTLGPITQDHAKAIEAITGAAVDGFDWALAADEISQWGADTGVDEPGGRFAVAISDLAIVAALLDDTAAVLRAAGGTAGRPALRLDVVRGGVVHHLIFEIRTEPRSIVLRTVRKTPAP